MKKTILWTGLFLCVLFGLLTPGRGEAHELADLKCEKNQPAIWNGTAWQCKEPPEKPKWYREVFNKRITLFVTYSRSNDILIVDRTPKVATDDTFEAGVKWAFTPAVFMWRKTSDERAKDWLNLITIYVQYSYGDMISDDLKTQGDEWGSRLKAGANLAVCFDSIFHKGKIGSECSSY